jgi:hypothetical protein
MARLILPLTGLCLLLTACGNNNKAALEELDARLGKNDSDPALTVPLEDQIMVDTALSQQANEDSVRPAERPVQTPIPPGEGGPSGGDPAQTLGALAVQQAQISKDRFNGCALDVDYSAQWAARLPGDLPLYPKARVTESAGSNNGSCSLRAVTAIAPAAPNAVAKHYSAAAQRAGYRASTTRDGDNMMVSGWRPSDGAAFYTIIRTDAGGTATDFVSNRGV